MSPDCRRKALHFANPIFKMGQDQMEKRNRSSAERRYGWPVAAGVGVFLCLALLVQILMQIGREKEEQTTRESVAQEVTTLAANLQAEINADVFLANGMVAFITAAPNARPKDMENALAALYRFGRSLRNIGVAPGNRIQYVYPREGNEGVLGLYYPDLPQQWPAVKNAIDRNETTVAGPLQLQQGGTGLISRTPVYLEDGQYWGILSLVLDADSIFEIVVEAEETSNVRFALRGKDGLGAEGAVFWGDAELFDGPAIIQTMPIPGGAWQIAGIPGGGWGAQSTGSRLLEGFGFLFSALAAVAVAILLKSRQDLAANQRRLAAFTASTHDGVVIVDSEDWIREVNPATERLLDRSAEEMLGAPLSEFLNADTDTAGIMRGSKADGTVVSVEARVAGVNVGKEKLRLYSLRDVTARLAAQNALQESEARFRRLASQVPGIIYQWEEHPDGRRGFTYVSPRAEDIFGLSPADLLEDWTRFRLHPDDVERWEATIREAVEQFSDWEFEGRLFARGEIRWWHAYSRPTRLPQGGLLFTGVILDVTEHKRAEDALSDKKRELLSILESMVDGVVTIDESGIMQSANPAVERLFGYPVSELLGKNVKMLMPEDVAAAHDGYLASYMATGQAQIIGIGRMVTGQRRDGSTFPLDLSVSETPTTRGRLFTGILRDATERVNHEQELERNRRIQEQRASELAVLAEDLEAAKIKAEQADEAKSRFLAMMSHEMRTPITGVLGMADLLLGSSMGQKQQEWTSILKRSAATFLTLLDDILDFSKIEAGRLVVEELDFDPRDVVEEVIELLENRVFSKGIALEWNVANQVPEAVLGDPTRLRQILFNLIGNAVKFTSEGRISVDLSQASIDEDGTHLLRFEVSDTGKGMTEEEVARLFRPFNQVDASTARIYGGTGLGLAICKSLSEIMGGSIGCKSRPGEGSTFWFTIRVKPGDPASVARRPAMETTPFDKPQSSRRVLVAEDNETNQLLLTEALGAWGHEVTVVGNGALAVDAVRDGVFDILLMDLQMPVMDGIDAARAIRAAESEPGKLPIVILTADVLAKPRLMNDPAMVSDVLTKPLDWERLGRVMEAVAGDRDAATGDDSAAGTLSAPEDQDELPTFSTEWISGFGSRIPEDKVKAILSSLVSRLDNFQTEVDEILGAGDVGAVRRFAHGLLGMASQFGLKRLAAKADELLNEHKEWDSSLAQSAAVELKQECAAARTEVSNCFERTFAP